MIYDGPLAEADKFFVQSGFVCPPNYNIADFYMDTISMDYRTEEASETQRKQIDTLVAAWQQHPYNQAIQSQSL